ncbi:MAG: HzsA-related protein [Pirellulales bacterium]
MSDAREIAQHQKLRPPVRSSVLPADAAPVGTVFVQDVYNGLEPWVRRGEVKRIMVVQELAKPSIGESTGFGFQRPVVSCGATYTPKKVLGFANVNEDGSAAFHVPANAPIYFLPLDAEGRAVQRMRTFTHLMPGEVQGCIGCHEPRSSTARDRVPPSALASTAQDLAPPEWGVRGFDYASIVQPVLDKHCLQCHNAKDSPKGVDLSGDRTMWFNVSYDVLAYETGALGGVNGEPWRSGSPYVSWISTMNGTETNILHIDPKTWGSPRSKLADFVLTGHPDENGKPRVHLTADERQRVLTWIDVNAPYYGTSTTTHPGLAGGRALEVKELAATLGEVASRRCAECHAAAPGAQGGRSGAPPVKDWMKRVRFTNPQNNAFLLAPLAKAAGGTEKCGKAVFAGVNDPDYQKIHKTFEPLTQLLKDNPRQDMPGARLPECERLEACPPEVTKSAAN